MKETSWCAFLKKSKLKLLKLSARRLDKWKILLNINNKYFDGLISQIYHPQLQLNQANFETSAPLLDLHLSILDGFI